MARGKAVTKRGKCLKCGKPVAWKYVDSGWRLYNVALDANGNPIVEASGAFRASDERHTGCWTNAGTQEKEESESTGNTMTTDANGTTTTTNTSIDLDALKKSLKGEMRAEMIATLEGFGIRQTTTIKVVGADGKALGTSGDEIAHPMLADVILNLSGGEPVYLYGPAGSGKSHGAVQAFRALGKEAIVCTMPGMTAGKLLGFQGLDGKDILTAFLRAWTEGIGFVADEFDRAIPAVGAAINSALANGFYTVGNRTIPCTPGFGFVATGNTDMRGATRQYTAAQPLDLATAARFAFVPWGYDEATEMAITLAILPTAAPLVEWMRAVRAMLARDQVETVWAGPRESMKVAKALVRGHSLRSAVDSWVWRGYPAENVRRYERECPLPKVEVSK